MSLIRKNIFWLLVSQAATWIATFVTLIVVPNKLGSNDFGDYSYATMYVQFFTLAAGLGTSAYLSRAIARDYSLVGPYVWNAVQLKFVLWGVLSAAALGLSYALGNRGQTFAMVAISCVGMLPFILTEVFFGALTGMQRIARPAMWTVAQVYFQTIFGILVLLLGWGVVAYTAVMMAGTLIPMAASALMVRPFLRGHRVFDWKIWRLLVVGGVPLLALTFFNLTYGSVDVPILHAMVGNDPVGWYTVALRWVGIPIFITTAVVGAFFPVFSQHGNPLTDEFAPLVNRAITIVLVVTIPASLGIAMVADEIVHLLYGSDYDDAIVLIRILALQIPTTALNTVLATAFVASNRLNKYLVVAAVAAVANPILCVFAINVSNERWGNGAIGASTVMVLTELWVTIGAVYLRSPGVLDRHEVGHLARITLAAAAMVPVLLVGANLPLAVQIGLGGAVYGVVGVLLGAISKDEVRDVVRQVTRRQLATDAVTATGERRADDGVEAGSA